MSVKGEEGDKNDLEVPSLCYWTLKGDLIRKQGREGP